MNLQTWIIKMIKKWTENRHNNVKDNKEYREPDKERWNLERILIKTSCKAQCKMKKGNNQVMIINSNVLWQNHHRLGPISIQSKLWSSKIRRTNSKDKVQIIWVCKTYTWINWRTRFLNHLWCDHQEEETQLHVGKFQHKTKAWCPKSWPKLNWKETGTS